MTTSYRLYDDRRDDFEARIRILTEEEGGRNYPPYNGIRWDFRYATGENSKVCFMLYPDFYYPETGDSWREMPVTIGEWLFARMYCIVPETRIRVHQKQVRPGTSFYCVEGNRIVAEGTVTRITGLFEER
ncbi:hypothetical protein HMJ29_18805 [Hymenobacter taeanensis]|uniref:Elongation factor Tu n=1 Tax=Hymenobacter taeanensis TaxID=2735321 RepID=A0A6M6BLZ9_9BACT|nr:hypothetical protein [Hymenobacter taeanensis]QJX48848.1 hypothetical protein HMJ29_18805 [Hymenobacter taeanensis]